MLRFYGDFGPGIESRLVIGWAEEGPEPTVLYLEGEREKILPEHECWVRAVIDDSRDPAGLRRRQLNSPDFKPETVVGPDAKRRDMAKEANTEEAKSEDVKPGRIAKARRSQKMKGNSEVGNAMREIEKVFDLPRGSVQLLLPSGKEARKDKLIRSLRRDCKKVSA